MSANDSYTALHALRLAKEIQHRKRMERVLGTAIAVGLMTLGSWAMWNHVLWLAVPFMGILVFDAIKALKEPLRYKVSTIGYAVLLPVAMWNHISILAFVTGVLVTISFTYAYKELKNK